MGTSADCFQNDLSPVSDSARSFNRTGSNLISTIMATSLLLVSFQQPVKSQTELTTTAVSNSITIESQAHYSFSVPGADVTRNGASESVMIYDQSQTAQEPQPLHTEVYGRGNNEQRLTEQNSALPPESVSVVDSSAHM